MSRHLRVLAIVICACCTLALSFAPAVRAAEPDVRIVQGEAGYTVTTSEYKARVGIDGNLHSLIIRGVEFLDDKAAGSLGASFFVDHALPLPTLTLNERTLTATDGTYTLIYQFEEGFIDLKLKQISTRGAAYVVIFSGSPTYVADLDLTGMAAIPAEYNWTDVSVTAPTGECLELHGGSRIWGTSRGTQVWELANIAPNKEYAITIIPLVREPREPRLPMLTTMTASYLGAELLTPAGKPVVFELKFDNNSNRTITSEVAIRAASSLRAPLLEERKPLTCEPHKSVTLTWTLNPQEPDFYTVNCAVDLEGTQKTLVSTFGYDAASIKLPTTRPVDLADYWAALTAEAKATPVKLTRLEDRDRSTSSVNVYRVGMEAGGFTCFGWLSVPKFTGRYPGLLILPGDHVRFISPNTALADNGFVVLTIEPTGQSVDGALKPLISAASANPDDAKRFGLRNIVLRYLFAVTALSTVPEVDANRLAISGVGLGGGMALLLAALDDRIQAVTPDVPYYCQIEYGNAQPDWPYREIRSYLKDHPEQQDQVMQTLRYFDVANFTDRITCPVLISAGINDTYSRPANIYSIFNQLPGPHAINLYPGGHDGGGAKHWEKKIHWLIQVLGGPMPPPAETPAAPADGANGGAPGVAPAPTPAPTPAPGTTAPTTTAPAAAPAEAPAP